MVCNSLQTGYNIREDHTGFGRTFSLGKTLYMLLLQFAFLFIYLITLDEEDIEEVYEVEKNINFLNHAITDYLVKINQTTLPIEDLNSLGALFHVVNDIERIGDHATNIAEWVIFSITGQHKSYETEKNGQNA